MTLVPWRGGEKLRRQNWDTCRPYLEKLGYDLFTGDSLGPWARAAACNAAAEMAGDWDVALVADADTILLKEPVHEAVKRVTKTKGAARPHDHRWMLSRVGSNQVHRGGLTKLDRRLLRSTAPGGGALVIHRAAWERVGGYPTDYVEWGYEDSAMNISLAVHSTWEIVPGNAYHLWHPMANVRAMSAQRNRALLDAHRATHWRELREASRRAGYDLNQVL